MTAHRSILICTGTGCVSNGAFGVKDAFEAELKKRNLDADVKATATGCNGFCERGPIVVIQPDDVFYQQLTAADVPLVVEEHLVKGRPVEKFMYSVETDQPKIPKMSDIEFFKHQTLVALRNRGRIDPEVIDDYIGNDGYFALSKALTEMTPEDVINEVKTSGLRGRGGGGFPTGVKWELTRKTPCEIKYIICNGDEGDPGAFMDRSLLEADPFSILEGMALGAYAIGACKGFIYVRDEYPLAVSRIQIAIERCRELGLLGDNILESDFCFDVEVIRGAGAFVCGEETALMISIEGREGSPRVRPPYPSESGLWGKPTNINNVETWANIAPIILRGGAWFSSLGTEKSKGTKIFSLVGKVNNTGLVEVPMGIPLKRIVYNIGGGIRDGKMFKAIQCGGPSGGCIPKSLMELPVDYEKLMAAGAIMGSGGMIVMDEDTCMVDLARYFMNFCAEESCGKCTPCREGTRQMLTILNRICAGNGLEGDIELLERLGKGIRLTSLCGLGQTAPNPVLSTIRHFRHEYEAHIKYKRCDAGVCQDLFLSPCQNTCPVGMDVPGYVSMIAAGKLEEAIRIGRETNPFLSICGRVCDHPCMVNCRRNQIDDSVQIRSLKRFMGDYAREKNLKSKIWKSDTRYDEKVAVIGSGPSGLGCAFFLARLGYPVTVFERHSVAGGLLAVGIPANRLPKDVLEYEIQLIRDLGVEIKTGVTVGEDIEIKDLLEQGYKAVYLSVGMLGHRKLAVPGEEAPQVYQGVDFLARVGLKEDVEIGRHVAIIGGGNTAVDAAGTALRLGAEKVTIVYRRDRKDMPAFDDEIILAEDEGINFIYLASPAAVLLDEKGNVSGLECVRMARGDYDTEGRRTPVAITDSNFVLDVDTVIPAIGEYADVRTLLKELEVGINRNGTIQVSDQGSTNVAGIFSGGDVASGASTVIRAVADGEKAAVSIDQYLRDSTDREYPWREKISSPIPFDPEADPVDYPGEKQAQVAVSERCSNFMEVELGLTPDQARKEAERCLRCDFREDDE